MDPIILLVVIILLLVLVNFMPLESNIKMIVSIAIILVALLLFLGRGRL